MIVYAGRDRFFDSPEAVCQRFLFGLTKSGDLRELGRSYQESIVVVCLQTQSIISVHPQSPKSFLILLTSPEAQLLAAPMHRELRGPVATPDGDVAAATFAGLESATPLGKPLSEFGCVHEDNIVHTNV